MPSLVARLSLVALFGFLFVACVPAAATSPTALPAKPAATAAPTTAVAPKPAEAKPVAEKAAPTAAPAKTEVPAAKALPADYFAGKTITIVAPFSAGGPADVWARLIAQFLPNHLPGKPTIIIQNMPGAGGDLGLGHLYSVVKKDGLTMGTITSPFVKVIDPGSAQYDLMNFIWLGAVDESNVSFTHKNLGAKTPEDLLKVSQQIVIGGLSPDSTKDLAERIFLNMLGVKYRYVTGYPGNADGRAAFIRGEINFFEESLSGWIPAIVPLVKEGTAFTMGQRGIVRSGQGVRDPRISDIPLYTEVAAAVKGPNVKNTIDYRGANLLLQMSALFRGLIYPPGVPQEVVDGVRKAVDATFADPEFQATGEKQIGIKSEYTPGAVSQQLVQQIVKEATADKEGIDYVKKLMAAVN